MNKRQIWDTWEGRRMRNKRTGEVLIETNDRDWHTRIEIWKANLDNGCPSPMPKGHLMFGGKPWTDYEPVGNES